MTEKNKNNETCQNVVEQKDKEDNQNLSKHFPPIAGMVEQKGTEDIQIRFRDKSMPEGLKRMLDIISTSVTPIDDKNK